MSYGNPLLSYLNCSRSQRGARVTSTPRAPTGVNRDPRPQSRYGCFRSERRYRRRAGLCAWSCRSVALPDQSQGARGLVHISLHTELAGGSEVLLRVPGVAITRVGRQPAIEVIAIA